MKQAKSNHQTFPMQPHSYCSLIRILLVSNRAHTGVSRERRVRLGAADWAPPIGHRRLGTADWAPPFGRWTFGCQNTAPDYCRIFLASFFCSYVVSVFSLLHSR